MVVVCVAGDRGESLEIEDGEMGENAQGKKRDGIEPGCLLAAVRSRWDRFLHQP